MDTPIQHNYALLSESVELLVSEIGQKIDLFDHSSAILPYAASFISPFMRAPRIEHLAVVNMILSSLFLGAPGQLFCTPVILIYI